MENWPLNKQNVALKFNLVNDVNNQHFGVISCLTSN
jgi:hypothetical protein